VEGFDFHIRQNRGCNGDTLFFFDFIASAYETSGRAPDEVPGTQMLLDQLWNFVKLIHEIGRHKPDYKIRLNITKLEVDAFSTLGQELSGSAILAFTGQIVTGER
jgi:hypothetical protein